MVRAIYGPVIYLDDGTPIRKVSTVYLQIGRGGRKTTFGAALAALHTFGYERVRNGENIVAAADRKQARRAYAELLGICQVTPWIAEKIHPQDYKNLITHPFSGSYFEAISSDAGTQHGRTPVFSLVDELHAHKNRDTFDVVQTGANKIDGSLVFIATTAGKGANAPDFSLYEYAVKVQRGDIEDPHFLPVIFEAPHDCDWKDEAVWKQFNPGLAHGFPSLIKLRQYAKQVAERPAEQEVFKQLHLGIRSAYNDNAWIEPHVIDACNAPVDLEAHEQFGDPCWIGVDAGVTRDLTAVVACWPDGNGGCDIWGWFPIPENTIHERASKDKVPYPLWEEQGFMQATPGNATSDPHVADLIRDLCKRFNVQEIAFDENYARGIYQPLTDEGLPVVIMAQNWRVLGPAIKKMENLIVSGAMSLGDHPVLKWNINNVVPRIDSNGNILFDKKKARDRIDGAQAAAMAIGRAFMTEIEETPIPFYMQPDFDPERALGIQNQSLSEADVAAEQERQAAIEKQARKMLGLD